MSSVAQQGINDIAFCLQDFQMFILSFFMSALLYHIVQFIAFMMDLMIFLLELDWFWLWASEIILDIASLLLINYNDLMFKKILYKNLFKQPFLS